MRDATHLQRELAASGRFDVRPGEPTPVMTARLFAQVPLDLNAPTSGDAVHVVANHGSWVVSCPDCSGAQLAHPADKRFLCNVCGNVGNARHFRPVVWPKDHDKIGELLDARADTRLRNWFPGETVADLAAENELIGGGAVPMGPGWAHPKWEGHTHKYPKRLPDPVTVNADGQTTPSVVECRECGLTVPVSSVLEDRAEGVKGADR